MLKLMIGFLLGCAVALVLLTPPEDPWKQVERAGIEHSMLEIHEAICAKGRIAICGER